MDMSRFFTNIALFVTHPHEISLLRSEYKKNLFRTLDFILQKDFQVQSPLKKLNYCYNSQKVQNSDFVIQQMKKYKTKFLDDEDFKNIDLFIKRNIDKLFELAKENKEKIIETKKPVVVNLNDYIITLSETIVNKLEEISKQMPHKRIKEIIKFCERKRDVVYLESLYHFATDMSALESGPLSTYFDEIRIESISTNPLKNIMGDNGHTGSCIEGPTGLYKEAALLGEICPNVGKLIMSSKASELNDFQQNVGVAYVLKCKDNIVGDEVWLIEGVETGIAMSLVKDQDLWEETFLYGICNAAKDAGISRIIFNTHLKNRRAKEYVRWLKTRKELYTEDGQKQFEYSLTLCDSSNGIIESLAEFGGKYYAEAWYADSDDNAFNCCDSEYEGRPLVKGIEVRVG